MVDVDNIVQVLAPAVTALGLDLYDVDVTGGGRARVMRVMVDRDGGVDLDAITGATEAITPILDARRSTTRSGPYTLEVSSAVSSDHSAPRPLPAGDGGHHLRQAPRGRDSPSGRVPGVVIAVADDVGSSSGSTTTPSSGSPSTTSRRPTRSSSGATAPRRNRNRAKPNTRKPRDAPPEQEAVRR